MFTISINRSNVVVKVNRYSLKKSGIIASLIGIPDKENSNGFKIRQSSVEAMSKKKLPIGDVLYNPTWI